MRWFWVSMFACGLTVAGCSSGAAKSNSSATTTARVATTTPSATTSPATTPTAAPAAPTASTSSTVATTAAAITPEILCVDSSSLAVYFAYTNSGTVPVAVDAGSGNAVSGGTDGDVPLQPTVFAPGRVAPAFWVYPDGEATWTLKGPDGTIRTATPDDSTPECTDALLAPTTPDNRAPDLTITYDAVPATADPPQQLNFHVTVSGVAATSVCPSGLTPQAPEIWTDDGNGGSVIVGATASRTLPFVQLTDSDTNQSQLVAQTLVAGLVVDVCGTNGAVTKSWPSSAAFAHLQNGEIACFRAANGTITMDVHDLGATCVSSPLPATGGQRIRSLP